MSGGSFERRLLERMLTAIGATSAGLALAAGCGGRSRDADPAAAPGGRQSASGGTSGGGGASGNGGASGTSVGGTGVIHISGGTAGSVAGFHQGGAGVGRHLCLVPVPSAGKAQQGWALAGYGGVPSMAGAGPGGTGGSGTGAGGAGGEAGEAWQAQAGEAGEPGFPACPAGQDAISRLAKNCDRTRLSDENWEVLAIERGPTIEDGACCYDTLLRVGECVYVGRAFLVDEGLLKSTVRDGDGWRFGPTPDVAELSDATRRALCEAWLKDGLFEHASVATFARFAIQLLAVGAPARLLHETLAAGRDEVRHAELCFALASAYAGRPLEPGAFPVGDTLPLDRALNGIVAETIVEGCIGETLAALQAAAQLEVASEPAVVESLRSTLEDETRHAELAWRVVAWAIETGGPDVRRIAERAFAGFEPPRAPSIDLRDVDARAFAAHGRLTPDEARRAALEALTHVVRPCAAALLGRDVMSHLAAGAGATLSAGASGPARP